MKKSITHFAGLFVWEEGGGWQQQRGGGDLGDEKSIASLRFQFVLKKCFSNIGEKKTGEIGQWLSNGYLFCFILRASIEGSAVMRLIGAILTADFCFGSSTRSTIQFPRIARCHFILDDH